MAHEDDHFNVSSLLTRKESEQSLILRNTLILIEIHSKTSLKTPRGQRGVAGVYDVSGQVAQARLGVWITYACGAIPTTGTN